MLERKEFKGNILVTISNEEVRLWVCNENGQNIYRFKAMGKVYKTEDFVTIMSNFKTKDNKG